MTYFKGAKKGEASRSGFGEPQNICPRVGWEFEVFDSLEMRRKQCECAKRNSGSGDDFEGRPFRAFEEGCDVVIPIFEEQPSP